MTFGRITERIDVVEIWLWIFFIAFAGVIYYLRKLDKREGYPLKTSPFDPMPRIGFPSPPAPKEYRLMEGGKTIAPHRNPPPPVSARPTHRFGGTPFIPVGNPLRAALGPGAWVMRRDAPMLTEQGELMLQPLRCLADWSVVRGDLDLRGCPVLDRRFVVVGHVHDLWIDRSIKILRLIEVTLQASESPQRVLVPIFHSDIRRADREVRVTALLANQFSDIPHIASPDVITAREDERLNAYFAAARFYRDADQLLSDNPSQPNR